MTYKFNPEEWRQRADAVQGQAAQAYARLLGYAEHYGGSGQARVIARFIAGTYNGSAYPFDLVQLREVDVEIGDDMLLCLEALRWGKADLHKLVPDGLGRVEEVIRLWEIRPAVGG